MLHFKAIRLVSLLALPSLLGSCAAEEGASSNLDSQSTGSSDLTQTGATSSAGAGSTTVGSQTTSGQTSMASGGSGQVDTSTGQMVETGGSTTAGIGGSPVAMGIGGSGGSSVMTANAGSNGLGSTNVGGAAIVTANGGGGGTGMSMGGANAQAGSTAQGGMGAEAGASADAGGTSSGGATQGEPEPSAVCGTGAGMPSLNIPNTLVSVPDSYDGSTPVPVVIAFHAAGNGNDQMRGIIGSTFDSEYILFYPKSDGSGWSNQSDPPKVDAIFDALDASACYDKNRVFATGHSSGAQFVVQRLCAGEDRWRAVSPVASSVYCSSWDPIPALVIHGIGDEERTAYGLNDGDGLKDIVPYRTSNSCDETFTPVEVEGCSSGGVQVDPGCRDFDNCVEKTRWCQHNDPQYGTSHHGVPCFGARVMKDFFDMFQ